MAEPNQTNQQAREAGVEAGRILERLAGHDAHFTRLNGSSEKNAAATIALEKLMQEILLEQRKQGQEAQADRDKAIALATALKEQAEKRWSPFARLWIIVGAVAALVGIAAWLMKAI